MIFADQKTRAGYFERNVFKKPLQSIGEIDKYKDVLSKDCIAIMEEFVQKQLNKGPDFVNRLHGNFAIDKDDDSSSVANNAYMRQSQNASGTPIQNGIILNNFANANFTSTTTQDNQFLSVLNKDMSFADQLPNRHFIDDNIN